MAIGIDLDGVIIDHHDAKRALAATLGFELLRWQTNTNVMRKFVPENIYEKLQIPLYTNWTPKAAAVPGALAGLRALKDAYIISARDANSIPYAEKWLGQNGVYNTIAKEKIIFCAIGADKAPLCEKLDISIFLDDKLSFLNFLPDKTKKVLFDEDNIAEKISLDSNIQLAKSWKEFIKLINPSWDGSL